MRLFIIDKTAFGELLKSSYAPKDGDHIAYMRQVQIINEKDVAQCVARGVTFSWIEENIDFKDRQEIDVFVQDFASFWYINNETKSIKADGLELGPHLTPDFIHDYAAAHMITFGEICQREVKRHAEIEEIISDISDGKGIFESDPLGSPKEKILLDVAERYGCDVVFFTPNDPLPAFSFWETRQSISQYLYSLLGGLRWKYLRAWRRHREQKKKAVRFYFFVHKGVFDLIKRIKAKTDVQVFSNTVLDDVTAARIDHVWSLPAANIIKLFMTVRACRTKLHGADSHPLATYGEINYLPYFARIIDHLYGPRLIATMFRFAQIKAFLNRLDLDYIFINGISRDMRAVIHFAERNGSKVVFLGHGMNSLKMPVREYTRHRNGVIWFCQGHSHPYGAAIPNEHDEYFPAVGSTLIDSMRGIVGQRAEKTGKRILMSGFSDAIGQTVTRAYLADTYMCDLFRAAKQLSKEGFRFTYRFHPGPSFSRKYIYDLIERLEVSDVIEIDDSPSFASALSRQDLLITNLSSTIYEAISVGWPVIIHEPDYQIDEMIGIMAAKDFEKPISSTSDALIDLIRSHENPSSLVNTFPNFILENHRERFFGENIKDVNEKMTDYIVANFTEKNARQRECAET